MQNESKQTKNSKKTELAAVIYAKRNCKIPGKRNNKYSLKKIGQHNLMTSREM